MKLHIKGDESHIEIEVRGRSHPSCTDFWDGNWLTSHIEIKIPGYHASFPLQLRSDELQTFTLELNEMNQTLKGKAKLTNMDSYLHIESEMNKFGKTKWWTETIYPPAFGAVLKLEFESDQTYLPKLIKELEAILVAYPVLGNP